LSHEAPAQDFAEPRILQSGGRQPGLGNRLLLYEIEGRPALLKLYRRRRAAWREPPKRFSYRFVEGKRGVTASERRHVECASLRLWREQGFDVPALLDHPYPAGVAAETALWMEYCPGPLLSSVLADGERPLEERGESAARFGAELARRQQRALDLEEPGLVMSHATAKHVLVHGDRHVCFDLETGYTRARPLLDALADELAGNLRSVLRAAAASRDALGEAFVRGYGDTGAEQLRTLALRGLRRRGLRARIQRTSDARRRGSLSEAGALRWLFERGGLAG
jgi:tRNA A-37 threonylcarbamoyl transferase component Bud32